MAKPTVYIETTIVSYLTARLPSDAVTAGKIVATRKWWDESKPRFELVTSQIVVSEASHGDPHAAAERLDAMAAIPLVPVLQAAEDLAELLLKRHALPAKARVDASHVALAATNSIVYLLTWNCTHLANATLRERIEAACKERGYRAPIICTPLELEEVLHDQ